MRTRELEKLELSLGGIKDMNGLPDAILLSVLITNISQLKKQTTQVFRYLRLLILTQLQMALTTSFPVTMMQHVLSNFTQIQQLLQSKKVAVLKLLKQQKKLLRNNSVEGQVLTCLNNEISRQVRACFTISNKGNLKWLKSQHHQLKNFVNVPAQV